MDTINQLKSLITNAAKAIEESEKLALPVIAAKARKEASYRPEDVPLSNASQVLTKMASSRTFISKNELRSILDRFTATHSKLNDVFAAELGKRQDEYKPHTFTRDPNEGSVDLNRDYARLADPVLANALAAAMEKNPTDKLYSKDVAQKAQRAVYAQLLSIGAAPKQIETFAGRNDIIVCQASYDTPKGIANALIPVEIKEGKALLPTVFLSQAGFKDLDSTTYTDHILSVAGKSFRVDGAKLLDVLHQIKTGSTNPVVSDVELAVIKLASERGGASFGQDNILYQELDNIKEDVKLPKLASTEESSFAETLGKPEGIARFIHSERVVEAGRALLVRKFAEIGFGMAQVKVAEVEKDKIFYAVAVGTSAGFKVPVEINGNMVMPPKIAFADGVVLPFSKQAISEIVKSNNGGNKKALAVASPCYDLKPSELLAVVKESVAEGNFARAEEAINVLGEIDPNTQKIAIANMMLNIYEPGQNPGEDKAEIKKLANKPAYDCPQLMTYKIFFPEGA